LILLNTVVLDRRADGGLGAPIGPVPQPLDNHEKWVEHGVCAVLRNPFMGLTLPAPRRHWARKKTIPERARPFVGGRFFERPHL
jgi:hypothetical protein